MGVLNVCRSIILTPCPYDPIGQVYPDAAAVQPRLHLLGPVRRYPTLYIEAAKTFFFKIRGRRHRPYHTIPKLFIEQLIWIDPATFPKL